MKLKAFVKKYLNWIAAVLIIAYCVYFYFDINKVSKDIQTDDLGINYRIRDTSNTDEYINYDSLPYWAIQNIENKRKHVEELQMHINRGDDACGDIAGFIWGLAYVKDGDIQSEHGKNRSGSFTSPNGEESDKRYFISISPYDISDKASDNYFILTQKKFVAQNNKYYLKYVVKDSVNEGDFYGHYTYRQIPIKYVKEYRALLVPVTYNNYLIADVFGFMVRFFGQLLVWYFLFYLPIKTIISISKGTPFDQKNIWRLSFISYFLLLFPFVLSGIKMLIHLLFLNKIPVEFTFHLQEYFFSYFKYILSGVVVFLIAQAFKRGYNLQKEQELTI